jgi:type IV secretory pathway protease TraF
MSSQVTSVMTFVASLMMSSLIFGYKNRCVNQKTLKKMGGVLVGLMLIYGIASHTLTFVLSATESLPYRFFVLQKRSGPSSHCPKKEAYVLFRHLGMDIPVIKQVKGIPGSIVRFDDQGQLWIDDFCVGKVHTTSITGKPVTPIKEGLIPPGYVFGYATHERSFDSRYQEFGLIPIESIQGSGIAVL